MFKAQIFFLVVLVACFDQALSLNCKNEQGKNVDWFVLLKPPKQKSDDPNISVGGGYGFITSESKAPGWTLAEKDLSDIDSFPGQTFAEVYKKPEDYSYVQYNDGKKTGREGFGHDSTIYAHAKGALVWNDKEAVWISHSAPKFLPAFHLKQYDYPASAKNHGQNFMCITLDSKKFVNTVLDHLVTMKAQVYAVHVSSKANPKMVELVQENINILAKKVKSNKGEPGQVLAEVDESRIKELTHKITSKGGEHFTMVVKSRKDNVDIWSSIAPLAIEPRPKEFAVKYWTLLQKATALLGSTCSRQKIVNVMDMEISFNNAPDLKIDWGRNDHSKWGLCIKGGDSCYCQGDMNRATTQFTRGGGVICMQNKKVHDTFEKSYTNQYDCDQQLQDNPKK